MVTDGTFGHPRKRHTALVLFETVSLAICYSSRYFQRYKFMHGVLSHRFFSISAPRELQWFSYHETIMATHSVVHDEKNKSILVRKLPKLLDPLLMNTKGWY